MITGAGRLRHDWLSRAVAGAVTGVILAAALLMGPHAEGATLTFTPSPTGYFTQTQDPLITVGQTAGTLLCGLMIPEACIDPSALVGGTPEYIRKDNFIYVTRLLGNDDARGVIGVPLFAVPLGAKVSEVILNFTVDNTADVGTLLFDPDNPGLFFCLVTQGWAGEDGGRWDLQPYTDCAIQAFPVKTGTETRNETTATGVPRIANLVHYKVDLLPMAAAWASGRENNGVMVLPTPSAPDIFEVAIRPAREMSVKVTYEGGSALGEAPAPPVDTVGSVPTGIGTDAGVTDTPPQAAPPFTVDEPSSPVSKKTTTPWWVYLSLPLGLAVLGGLARGTSEPIGAAGPAKRGPVSRLMDRR